MKRSELIKKIRNCLNGPLEYYLAWDLADKILLEIEKEGFLNELKKDDLNIKKEFKMDWYLIRNISILLSLLILQIICLYLLKYIILN